MTTDDPAPSPDPLNVVGLDLGDYRVVRYCGHGAAGHVYEANRGGRHIALKLYKDWLFERDAAAQDARIARESAIRDIDHPNVCKVLDHGRVSVHGVDRRYLAMEFIQGDSLEAAIARGLFSDSRAFADVALQLVGGLRALHDAGSVHRDLKPANVMLEEASGRAVITDFGVVADLEATTLLTQGHEFLGTIRYAAPEWIYREPPEAAHEPAIDVYSLGATLLEMMTGKPPFADIHNRHQLGEAVRKQIPTVIAPHGFARRLAAMIREMLAKDPRTRPTLEQAQTVLATLPEDAAPEPIADSGDPFERYRQLMANREDVRRAADRERFIKARWSVFESMWNELEAAWEKWESDPIGQLPGVIETAVEWRGDAAWFNSEELKRAFPDRMWTWGRSFDIIVAPPGKDAHCCYFFHGLEDDDVTGITRFVATLKHRKRADSSYLFEPDTIDVYTAESWMGHVPTALSLAIRDVREAKRLLLELLTRSNAS